MIPGTPARQFIGLAVERLEVLAKPSNQEPSPALAGATPAEWAEWAGIGHDSVHHAVDGLLDPGMEVGPYPPDDIAWSALRRLTARGVTERVPGRPIRYRPLWRP